MSGVVAVTRGAWGVERVRIWRGQWQAMPEPVHEIRVGDKRCAKRYSIGLASGESIAATPLIVTAILNKGPFIGVADEGRDWRYAVLRFRFENMEIGEIKTIQQRRYARESD